VTSRVPFQLVSPPQRGNRELLANRRVPRALGSLEVSAPQFRPSQELVAAINVALALGAPLLLTGEPGTGKTQVAFYLAWYFGLEAERSFFQMDVRSTSSASDLLYQFDTVAYFHAAHDPSRAGQSLNRGEFVRRGPLWHALVAEGPTLLLIDEIDKAPRDFPNDLLRVLAEGTFEVPELGQRIRRRDDASPPLVVVTSNSERRLPEPFLRRCIFHHIEFSEEVLRHAVEARRQDFSTLGASVIDAAIGRLVEIRERNVRKKPGTAELLAWLIVLAAEGGVTEEVLRRPLRDLPALSALIKDRDDLKSL
jgi:MoxR-like ATPase